MFKVLTALCWAIRLIAVFPRSFFRNSGRYFGKQYGLAKCYGDEFKNTYIRAEVLTCCANGGAIFDLCALNAENGEIRGVDKRQINHRCKPCAVEIIYGLFIISLMARLRQHEIDPFAS